MSKWERVKQNSTGKIYQALCCDGSPGVVDELKRGLGLDAVKANNFGGVVITLVSGNSGVVGESVNLPKEAWVILGMGELGMSWLTGEHFHQLFSINFSVGAWRPWEILENV